MIFVFFFCNFALGKNIFNWILTPFHKFRFLVRALDSRLSVYVKYIDNDLFFVFAFLIAIREIAGGCFFSFTSYTHTYTRTHTKNRYMRFSWVYVFCDNDLCKMFIEFLGLSRLFFGSYLCIPICLIIRIRANSKIYSNPIKLLFFFF